VEKKTMPKIDLENCKGCGLCIDACINSAIAIENKKAVIDKDLCLGCGVCIGSCPNEAIIPEKHRTKHRYSRPMSRRYRYYNPHFRRIHYPYLHKLRKNWF
jgi:MinD superfamily P-loop ATPase